MKKFLSWSLSFFASFARRLIKMLSIFFFVCYAVVVVAVVSVVAFLMKKFLTLFLLFLILWFGLVRFIFGRSCAVFSGFLLVLHAHTLYYWIKCWCWKNKRWHVVDYQYSLRCLSRLCAFFSFSLCFIDWKRVLDLLTKFLPPHIEWHTKRLNITMCMMV